MNYFLVCCQNYNYDNKLNMMRPEVNLFTT